MEDGTATAPYSAAKLAIKTHRSHLMIESTPSSCPQFLLKQRLNLVLALALAVLTCLFRFEAKAQLFWNTNGTGATWTAANWGASAIGPFTTAWTANSNVQFTADSTVTFASTSIGNLTVADGKTVTISQNGTMSSNSAVRTFDVGTGATLTWTGQGVSSNSTSGFIKNGVGTWNIGSQANDYTGGFTLNAGTVIVSGNKSFGGAGSLLTINGGTIQSSGTRDFANNIVIGGNFTNSGTGNATFSGTVNVGGSTRIITNTTTSGSRIYSGIISGSSGAGLTFDGTGAGQTYIGNAANSFTGTITINGSEVGFASNGAFGNANNTIVIDGGRLSAASTAGAAASYTLASTHGIQLGSTTGTSISPVSGGTLSYDGVISDLSGATGAWAKQGSGTIILGGASTYTGGTAINNGAIQLTSGSNRLPITTTVSLGQSSSANLGTLDLNGQNQQIAGLVSTLGTNATASNNTVTSVTSATLTIGGSATAVFGNGSNTNSGVITGAISLVKSGSGTQVLGDANTYTGTTLISAGTLQVGASNTGTSGTGDVTVNGATAVLAGTGSVAATTTSVILGTIKPGDSGGSSVGTLNTKNLEFTPVSSTTVTELQIASSSSADLLNIVGNLSLNSFSNVFVNGSGYIAAIGHSFTLIDWTGLLTLNGFSTGTNLRTGNNAAGNEGNLDLPDISAIGAWNISNFSGSGSLTISVVAVPEPSRVLLLALGSGLLIARRKR